MAMDGVKLVLQGMAHGTRDSLIGVVTLFHLDREQAKGGQHSPTFNRKNEEPRVVHRMLQCCALNGGVFWLSIFIFYNILLPFLRGLLLLIFGNSSVAGLLWSWMKPVLSYTFSAAWVLPLFVLSRVVNSLWFQDIADQAYRHTRGRPQVLSSISKLLADTLCSLLVQALFLIQGMLAGLLPITPVGECISLIHMSLLYSLYAFEYKWYNMGWELHKRLSFIENNWPYFVGFGLPLAVLTSLPSSYVISGCVFSILFPIFILSGNAAEPFRGTCDYPLQLFSPVVYISNVIFQRTMKPAQPTKVISPQMSATNSPARRRPR